MNHTDLKDEKLSREDYKTILPAMKNTEERESVTKMLQDNIVTAREGEVILMWF